MLNSENLKDLIATSPHYFSEITRSFKDEEEVAQLSLALNWVRLNNGYLELDFTRRTGSSYNPRPARIALIVLKEELLIDFRVVIVAVLFTSPRATWPESEISLGMSKENYRIIIEMLNALDLHLSNSDFQLSEQTAKITLAHFLDRARHFHLKPNASKEDWHAIIVQGKKYLQLAQVYNSALYKKLAHWVTREECKRLN